MARKRIRIDIEDSDGAKYDIKVEGNVTREKVLKIFEMMELMNIEAEENAVTPTSVGAKIWHIIDKHYPVGPFTSTGIREKYEDEYNEPIKLSIISTYLARFTNRGKTNRTKSGKEWIYQIQRPTPILNKP
ncbi:MAG: hypothetical protein K8823_158 [Cenarchaeum symbiont of Oopsacas minuta]|nr:hypothetical protein [Cenarchaeum symbiont of Oopsacas minuta]